MLGHDADDDRSVCGVVKQPICGELYTPLGKERSSAPVRVLATSEEVGLDGLTD